MKTALILISIISLVSILTVNSLNKYQNLRSSDDITCLSSTLDMGNLYITVTNACQKNVTFKFSVSASDQNETKKLDFETICLKQKETQRFELDFPRSYTTFTQSVKEQNDC
ncbi:transmembrane protein, putative (macronuclear) [Tetrahymena thermophila SB210]|uniref:Transmembrane protein, putative n=1 Tax=Tetrahymena thermophila (strain SB210) TaxID=312017 RepID=Q23YI6_TETTS|nr:transmembrane protein, putative [Tetrahymena thermophila SB210]EAS01586.1 transmembrane protein, putative [Tetrahymena thermophila SB210]|eukprot:XP_001021831.1 transmembrane protein, putative [Tetrahymena thermophila SB210]